MTLELDVTSAAQAKSAVQQAHAYFGCLDIVLNNAGYSLIGAIEEASAEEIRALYETNTLGPVAVIPGCVALLRTGWRAYPGNIEQSGPRDIAGHRLLRFFQMGFRGHLRKSFRGTKSIRD